MAIRHANAWSASVSCPRRCGQLVAPRLPSAAPAAAAPVAGPVRDQLNTLLYARLDWIEAGVLPGPGLRVTRVSRLADGGGVLPQPTAAGIGRVGYNTWDCQSPNALCGGRLQRDLIS